MLLSKLWNSPGNQRNSHKVGPENYRTHKELSGSYLLTCCSVAYSSHPSVDLDFGPLCCTRLYPLSLSAQVCIAVVFLPSRNGIGTSICVRLAHEGKSSSVAWLRPKVEGPGPASLSFGGKRDPLHSTWSGWKLKQKLNKIA